MQRIAALYIKESLFYLQETIFLEILSTSNLLSLLTLHALSREDLRSLFSSFQGLLSFFTLQHLLSVSTSANIDKYLNCRHVWVLRLWEMEDLHVALETKPEHTNGVKTKN